MRERYDTSGARPRALGLTTGAVLALAGLVGGLLLGDGPARAQSQAAPTNTGEPRVSGTPEVGSRLTGTQGSWTGTPSEFRYQWVRCDPAGSRPDGSDCAAIGGATTLSYVAGGGDAGKRLRFRVTASNADGASTAASNATAAVREAPQPATGPKNTKAPVITGTPNRDQVLRVSPGTWTGTQPITFSYQWLRCDANGNNCSVLAGFSDDAYTVRDGDVGRRVRARVTARNTTGSTSTLTAATPAIGAALAPAEAIKLPNGEISIPVGIVPKGERLVVDQVLFSPNPVRSRTQFTARIKVKDTRGNVVRDAIVFLRSTPLVTTATQTARTGQDGWVTIDIRPRSNFPRPAPNKNIQFFVRAYRSGDPVLAGVSSRRLVQVALST
jgi:hypothetical protein